jgi:hypothetical protein
VVGVDLRVVEVLRGDAVLVAGRVVVGRVVAVGEEGVARGLRFEVYCGGGEADGFLWLGLGWRG